MMWLFLLEMRDPPPPPWSSPHLRVDVEGEEQKLVAMVTGRPGLTGVTPSMHNSFHTTKRKKAAVNGTKSVA